MNFMNGVAFSNGVHACIHVGDSSPSGLSLCLFVILSLLTWMTKEVRLH